MISEFIKKLQEKTNLSYDEINGIMTDILSGKTTDSENALFLSNLADKGETDDELLGMLDKMNEFALKVVPKNQGTLSICVVLEETSFKPSTYPQLHLL